MDLIKKKYTFKTNLYLVLLAITLILIFFTIFYDRSVLLLIAFIVAALLVSCLFYYNFVCYLNLHSKKQEVLYETKVDRTGYFEIKKAKKERRIKIHEKIMKYALYIAPFLMAALIALGVFVIDSALLALVLPAFILVLLLGFFFFKEIYMNAKIEDCDIAEKETVFVNKNIICYNGYCYLYKGFGFDFKENKQIFLKMKIASLDIKEEEVKAKIMELVDVRD